jgi:hypothetical protein
MKNISNKHIDSLIKKIINETFEEKADELVSKLTEGDNMVCEQCGSSSLMEGECTECGYNKMYEEMDYLGEGENVCEECGNQMNEGICEQCSSMNESDEFDYVAEEEEELGSDPLGYTERYCDKESSDYNAQSCKYFQERVNNGGEMSEKLYGNQKNLDHNKNGRIDSDDLRMARAKKTKNSKVETDEDMIPGIGDENMRKHREGVLRLFKKLYPDDQHIDKELRKKDKDGEMEEGNAFSGALADAKKQGKKKFKVDGETYPVRESKKQIQMTESEMIEFIERIVLQEEEKLKSMGKTKGLNVYQKAHTASGKENKEYLKSVVKKMKDYLKDGSKGEYDTNPDIFPKGNGELAKMDKKAYTPSDAVQDYTDNFTAAGLENLDYDEIHPNEDWVNDNVEGSSRTGNNPEWANTGKSDVNKKRNKIRKDNMLAKVKRKAYNKSPQPVVQDTQDGEKANKILMKLESTDEKTQKKINEEFDRMKNLMGYNQKTQ